MIKRPEVLAIIPARGGSKSIPKKSIAPCAGRPLIQYTIEAAKRSKRISRLIISTDSAEIAGVAGALGVEVPFMRPEALAEDATPDWPVFDHALRELRARDRYDPDVVVHLRPTTPLKKSADIDQGIEMLLNHPEADSVRSICEPEHTPFKMYTIDERSGMLQPLLLKAFPEVFERYPEAYNMPRQLLPSVWKHSGYVDVVRPYVISDRHSMSGTQILPLRFEKWRDIDIDSPAELAMAEMRVKELEAQGKTVWD